MRKLAILAAAALIAATGSAPAAEIDALVTTAMKAAIDELVPPFERANGHNVRVSYGPSGGVARRVIGGGPGAGGQARGGRPQGPRERLGRIRLRSTHYVPPLPAERL